MINEASSTSTDVVPDVIFQIALGYMAAKHLFVASEIDLFAQLAVGPTTLDDLCARTGVPRRTLRISADAMVALGFVERVGDLYRNGPVASAYLSGQGTADYGPILRFWNRISYPSWLHFEEAIRSGEATNQQGGGFSEADQRIFSEGMAAFAELPAEVLATSYDFAGHQRLLDLGGGVGSFLLPALRRNAHLHGTIFDLPGAGAVARSFLDGRPEGNRIDVVEGDFLKDAIPTGHDVMIVANVVHVLSPEHNLTLFQSAHAAASPATRLLIVDVLTDATHTQPVFAALAAGEFLVIAGEGDVYSEEEVREWLLETGWRPLERMELGGPTNLLVAEAI
jgi:hypothetical protein